MTGARGGCDIARQSAFQFMKAGDPRISMLRRFAKAMEIPIEELVGDKPKRNAENGKGNHAC
jgi:hypothetical protein